jgi:hypothetical protein
MLSLVLMLAGMAGVPGYAERNLAKSTSPSTSSSLSSPSKQPMARKIVETKASQPVNYFAHSKPSDQSKQKPRTDTRALFTVVGTDCYTCLKRMKRKMTRVAGVRNVYIMSWEPYQAFVTFDSTRATWPDIVQSVADEKVKFVDVKIEPIPPKTK